MNILDEARNILAASSYFVSRISENVIEFEDDTLLGFACQMPAAEILDSWGKEQETFVSRNASKLRRSALKSWNLYSVFLAADPIPEGRRKKWIAIEEDFRATRKLVQADITSASDVVRALYPFIPIQNVVTLRLDDLSEKLRTRLSGLPPGAVEALLDRAKSDQAALKAFEETHATQSS